MSNTKKPLRTVIFDFDGTLADTFVTSVRIFEKMTNRAQPFSVEDIMRLRGLTAFHVAREFKVRPWRIPWLIVRGRALMRREIENIVVFDGIEDVLKALRQADVPTYIISSNSPGNIRKLLRAKGLDDYFVRIYGNVGLFGKAKMLRRVIARSHLDKSQTYYVGDEGRDIEAAKRVGVHGVGVSWGFNTAELLTRHHPHAIASTPADLTKILLADSGKNII